LRLSADPLDSVFDNSQVCHPELVAEGRGPPTHSPLRLEAAILSRMRWEVTSRSSWAKDSSTLQWQRAHHRADAGRLKPFSIASCGS
jgi:hypothetical protein